MDEPIDEILFGSRMQEPAAAEIYHDVHEEDDDEANLTETQKKNLETKKKFYRDKNAFFSRIAQDYNFKQ